MPRIIDNQAVNGSAGAFTNFSSTIPARKITIMEDPVNGSNAGLQVQLRDDSTGVPYATTINIAGGESVVIGNTIAHGNAAGGLVGLPDQSGGKGSSGQTATVYAKIKSAGVGATKVRTIEVE